MGKRVLWSVIQPVAAAGSRQRRPGRRAETHAALGLAGLAGAHLSECISAPCRRLRAEEIIGILQRTRMQGEDKGRK